VRRVPAIVSLLLALAALAGGTGAILVAVAAASIESDLDHMLPPPRRPLEPVPVAASACPALAAVRESARRAGDLWIAVPANWQTFAAQLGPELDTFARALRAAIPVTPPVVASRLRTVLHEVEIGLRQLPASTDLSRYLDATHFALFEGVDALADASDLVGGACGAPIYAGLATGLTR
jgi:hypothetical protein